MNPVLKPISKFYQGLSALAAMFFLLLAILDLSQSILKPIASQSIKASINPFTVLKLEAEAVLVYDPENAVTVFEKNAETPLPIASVTKVMTALATNELLPPAAAIPFGRKNWRLPELIDYTLVTSSNEAAAAITAAAETQTGRLVVDEMNRLARRLNLTKTAFKNVTGLDLPNGEVSAVSSARDIARLIAYVLTHQPQLLEATRHSEPVVTTFDGIRYRLANTNLISNDIPGLLASKTGFTDAAKGSLVVALDRGLNQPIIIVVLGSSETGRFGDAKKLVDAVILYYGH